MPLFPVCCALPGKISVKDQFLLQRSPIDCECVIRNLKKEVALAHVGLLGERFGLLITLLLW